MKQSKHGRTKKKNLNVKGVDLQTILLHNSQIVIIWSKEYLQRAVGFYKKELKQGYSLYGHAVAKPVTVVGY
jgi:hypothetical protein